MTSKHEIKAKSKSCPYTTVKEPTLENNKDASIRHPNNNMKESIPTAHKMNEEVHHVVERAIQTAGADGTLSLPGAGNQFTMAMLWRQASKLVPGQNNNAWSNILSSYAGNNRTANNLRRAGGRLVAEANGLPQTLRESLHNFWK